MLIEEFRQEYVRPPHPSAKHLRCFAYFEADIGEILPHLNAVLKGHQLSQQPPMLTVKHRVGDQARLITIYPHEIAINIVMDQQEAGEILEWLRQVINDTWERRNEIQPRTDVPSKPRILDILKLLPQSNCGQCGLPTCMVFATQVSEGLKSPTACPPLEEGNRKKLAEYLANF
ncbi:MAG: (Fe-S)-binding protein [Thermodesulfobacteriota bacterium]